MVSEYSGVPAPRPAHANIGGPRSSTTRSFCKLSWLPRRVLLGTIAHLDTRAPPTLLQDRRGQCGEIGPCFFDALGGRLLEPQARLRRVWVTGGTFGEVAAEHQLGIWLEEDGSYSQRPGYDPAGLARTAFGQGRRTRRAGFFVSSFRSATSNEVVLVGNELFPTWSGEGAAQPPVLRPRLVIRLSPQSAKDLCDVLQNFVANFERAYGRIAHRLPVAQTDRPGLTPRPPPAGYPFVRSKATIPSPRPAV